LDCRHVCKTCAYYDAVQAGKHKLVHHTPLTWRPQAPDQETIHRTFQTHLVVVSMYVLRFSECV
jgi:hypothetical protein